MQRVVWLASFPKSGNTWFRFLLANLKSGSSEPVDINSSLETDEHLNGRGPFDSITMIESALLTHDEVDDLRPGVFEALTREGDGDYYAKVHDAYTLNRAGEPVLGRHTARAAIYIIRDPRDVAVSLAHHLSSTIDKAVSIVNSPISELVGGRSHPNKQFRQKLLGWSGHVASWLAQTDIPVHVVRYEDLKADAESTFGTALEFLGQPAASADIERAVRNSSFQELQKQESTKGFRERISTTAQFFRRGEEGAWRRELNEEQACQIVATHGAFMRQFGYLPEVKAEEREETAALALVGG